MAESDRTPGKSAAGYRKLVAFKIAHELVKKVYHVTTLFPKDERFGLTSQMRRAAVSVAANIVEGHALNSTAQFIRHLSISFGSCKEIEYYIDLSEELEYIKCENAEELRSLESQAAYLINALLNALKRRVSKVAEPVAPEYAFDSFDSFDSSDSFDSPGDLS
jgi:four helix bundle protein